jgi:Asp-tRNA(Asn)/Glu-tRNA(Gln) amidotransferase A subunit family amidase
MGPIAREVQDGALLFSVIAGYDARDPRALGLFIRDTVACLDEARRSTSG